MQAQPSYTPKPSSKSFTYKGEYTREISFPLGGIGSGCIELRLGANPLSLGYNNNTHAYTLGSNNSLLFNQALVMKPGDRVAVKVQNEP